jgi:hypothetical protein
MQLSLQQRIRERAYELWNTTGRMHGHAEQHWLAAEREILSEMTAQTPAAQNKPAPARQRRAAASARSQLRKVAKAS